MVTLPTARVCYGLPLVILSPYWAHNQKEPLHIQEFFFNSIKRNVKSLS